MISITAPTPAQAADLAARLQVVDLSGEPCVLNVDKVIALRFNDTGRLVIVSGYLMSEGRKVYFKCPQVTAVLDTVEGILLNTPANRLRLRAAFPASRLA